MTATSSGLRTLPMVVGLLITSIAAGTIVGRTGRYKIFPVTGTLIMGIGLFLLSRLDASSGFWTTSLAMLVLGTLGSSFGAAVFGALYSNALGSRLPAAVSGSPGVDPARITTPEALHKYPASMISKIVDESDKIIVAVKAWIAEGLGPETAGDHDALERALDNLAQNMLTEESPAVASA